MSRFQGLGFRSGFFGVPSSWDDGLGFRELIPGITGQGIGCFGFRVLGFWLFFNETIQTIHCFILGSQ